MKVAFGLINEAAQCEFATSHFAQMELPRFWDAQIVQQPRVSKKLFR
jgi:hypothetical protein